MQTVVSYVMRHIPLIISTLLILASCQTNDTFHSDSFRLLLPDTSKTHKPNTLFDDLKNWSKQMSLPRMDTGVNNFELRLWTRSRIDPDNMVVLRISDTNVIAEKFNYNTSADSLEHFKLSDTYHNAILTQFADSLQKVDFSKMISQNEIKNFHDNIADGIRYYMEIATPKYYKLVSYHCPGHFAKTEANNKNFLNLIMALDSHLHFYSPICSF